MLSSTFRKPFREDIMSPRSFFSKIPKALHRKSTDQRRPQAEPSSSSTPASTSQPRPHAPAVAQPEPRELSPKTAAALLPAAASRLPGRLWTQAYDAVNEANPKLVHAYETLLRRVPGEPDPAPEAEDDRADVELTRTQMVRLVQAGLEKTKGEAEKKKKAGEAVRVISSVRDLVGAALRHAPEAAAAWGGVCLLLQVSCYLRNRQTSSNWCSWSKTRSRRRVLIATEWLMSSRGWPGTGSCRLFSRGTRGASPRCETS